MTGDVRMGVRIVRAPLPWSTPFAVPRSAVTWGLDAHHGGLAWLWMQSAWRAAGYVIDARGHLDAIAD